MLLLFPKIIIFVANGSFWAKFGPKNCFSMRIDNCNLALSNRKLYSYVPTLPFWMVDCRFGRLSPVLPFDFEISRSEGNVSKFSIFCKNSNMYCKLLHLLVFYLHNCYWQCKEYTVDPVNSLFLQWFIKGFAKYVLKNGKIMIFLN